MLQNTLVAATATKESPVVKVPKNKTIEFPFGPPFKPLVRVSHVFPTSASKPEGPRKAYLQLRIVGSAGENCTNLLVKGRKTQVAPIQDCHQERQTRKERQIRVRLRLHLFVLVASTFQA